MRTSTSVALLNLEYRIQSSTSLSHLLVHLPALISRMVIDDSLLSHSSSVGRASQSSLGCYKLFLLSFPPYLRVVVSHLAQTWLPKKFAASPTKQAPFLPLQLEPASFPFPGSCQTNFQLFPKATLSKILNLKKKTEKDQGGQHPESPSCSTNIRAKCSSGGTEQRVVCAKPSHTH